MIAKLYERKATLEAREEVLRAEIAMIKAKCEVLDEMIKEEESLVKPAVSEEVITEKAEDVVEVVKEDEAKEVITIRF